MENPLSEFIAELHNKRERLEQVRDALHAANRDLLTHTVNTRTLATASDTAYLHTARVLLEGISHLDPLGTPKSSAELGDMMSQKFRRYMTPTVHACLRKVAHALLCMRQPQVCERIEVGMRAVEAIQDLQAMWSERENSFAEHVDSAMDEQIANIDLLIAQSKAFQSSSIEEMTEKLEQSKREIRNQEEHMIHFELEKMQEELKTSEDFQNKLNKRRSELHNEIETQVEANKALEHRVGELELQLEGSKQTGEHLQGTRETLETEINTLNEKIANMNVPEEFADLKTEIDRLQAQLHEGKLAMETELQLRREEKQNLERAKADFEVRTTQELQTLREEIETLNRASDQEKETFLKNMRDLEREKRSVKGTIDNLNQEISSHEKDVEEKKKEQAGLESLRKRLFDEKTTIIQTLKDEFAALVEDVKQFRATIDADKETIEHQTREIAETLNREQDIFEKLNNRVGELNAEKSKLLQEQARLRGEEESLSSEIESLRSSNQDAEDAINGLKGQLQELQNRNEGLSIEKRKLDESVNGLSETVGALEGDVVSLSEKKDDLDARIIALTQEKEHIDTRIKEQETELQALDRYTKRKTEETEKLSIEIEQKNASLKELVEAYIQVAGELQQKENYLQQKRGEIENINQQLTERQTEIEGIDRQLTERQTEIEGINRQLTERQTEIEHLQEQRESLFGQIREERLKVEEVEKHIGILEESLKKQREHYRENEVGMDKEIKRQKAEAERIQKYQNDLTTELNELGRELEGIQKENTEKIAQRDKLDGAISSARELSESLTKEIAQKKGELKAHENFINELRNAFKDKMEEMNKLLGKKEELKMEIQNLRETESAHLEDAKTKLDEMLNSLRESFGREQKVLSQRRAEKERLETEIGRVRREMETLDGQNGELQKSLDELKEIEKTRANSFLNMFNRVWHPDQDEAPKN